MRVVEAAREICCRRRSDEDGLEDRFMRFLLEERSPLRVELEAVAAEGSMTYRVQQSISPSVELTAESVDDCVLYWTEDMNSTEILMKRGSGQSATLIRLERGLAGYLTIEIAACELKIAREVGREFATRFGRKPEQEDESRVRVSFWRDGSPQPDSNDRFLETVRWKDVSANYGVATAGKLDALMRATSTDIEGGRLMLWHGKPGTGKTYALRALANEWKRWCDIHYITDPEALLGRAAYLLHLILQDTGDEKRWRLLVMEDTGELLSIDARQSVGQALSRLLNTTEGLLGQGLRVLFLITTNEELGRLNPAVIRPGRCLSAIEFAPFTREEAHSWLSRSRIQTEPWDPLTLSELYAMRSGRKVENPMRMIGFSSGDLHDADDKTADGLESRG